MAAIIILLLSLAAPSLISCSWPSDFLCGVWLLHFLWAHARNNFNARSLTNKRQELLDTLRSLSLTPQIIAITETWLTDNIPDGMISLPNYKQIFRADRPKQEGRRGGGVLILARVAVVCSRRNDLRTWSESVWIEARVQFSTPLIICCIYRPPSTATADSSQLA